MRDPELTLDQDVLDQWLGRCREKKDRIDVKTANFMKATLNKGGREYRNGDILPEGWHWLYFQESPRMDQLGRDGHAAPGDFLPPVALPKRMWAGARLKFSNPIIIGEQLVRTSVIKNITKKSGRGGDLCFVTVNHRLFTGSFLNLEEEHDIVYLGGAAKKTSKSPFTAPTDADHRIEIQPTSTLLFRYSALTFNGHRIHYDLDFCREVENYPSLVVHAPLTATLMLDMAKAYFKNKSADQRFADVSFKAVNPLFCDQPFSIHIKELENYCELWAANSRGMAMSATLSLG